MWPLTPNTLHSPSLTHLKVRCVILSSSVGFTRRWGRKLQGIATCSSTVCRISERSQAFHRSGYILCFVVVVLLLLLVFFYCSPVFTQLATRYQKKSIYTYPYISIIHPSSLALSLLSSTYIDYFNAIVLLILFIFIHLLCLIIQLDGCTYMCW